MAIDIREGMQNAKGTPVPSMHKTTYSAEGTVTKDRSTVSTKENTGRFNDQTTTPMGTQEYTDLLRKELVDDGFEDKDAFKVLDSLLTKGNYDFEFSLLGKVRCVFRVRPDWVQRQALVEIEKSNPKTVASLTDVINRYNLAGAVVEFMGKRFRLESAADLDFTINYLENLPFAIINILISKLVVFDKLVAVATSAWALENFTEPRPEK